MNFFKNLWRDIRGIGLIPLAFAFWSIAWATLWHSWLTTLLLTPTVICAMCMAYTKGRGTGYEEGADMVMDIVYPDRDRL